jgi:hypothetical protein
MKRHALIALGLACAFGIGRLTIAVSSPTHTERVIERQPVEHRVVHAASSSSPLSAEDVRAIVNDTLAAHAPAEAEQPSPVHPVDPAAPALARTIVTDGTADGRWTVEDRERLRGVFDRLNREQASEVLSSLYGEINAGRVHLELDGPPT